MKQSNKSNNNVKNSLNKNCKSCNNKSNNNIKNSNQVNGFDDDESKSFELDENDDHSFELK